MKFLSFLTVLTMTFSVFAQSNPAAGKETLYLTTSGRGLDLVRLETTGNDWLFTFYSGSYTAKLKSVGPGHLYGMYKGSKKLVTPDMVVNMSVNENGASIVYTIQNMTAGNAPLESISAVRVHADSSACTEISGNKFCAGNKVSVPAHDQQLVPRIYNIEHLLYNDKGQALAFKEVYGIAPISELAVAHVIDLQNPSVRCAKPGVCIGDSVSYNSGNLFHPVDQGTVIGFSPDGILLSNSSDSIVESVIAAMEPVKFAKAVNTACDDLSENQKKDLWRKAADEANAQCMATGRADECFERPARRNNVISWDVVYSEPTADGKGCQFVGSSMGIVKSPLK
jgi:hypothetical protein